MRDLTLSLLSRGCGLVVRSDRDSQDGRLEVCFEPEDYYIWKSHQPQLRLSNSGRFLGGAEPVPPKTYSTRRGPLFLYSEDLASMTTGLPEANRKRQVSQQSRQEMDLHLHTLRDLTGALLAYGKKRLRRDTATATGLPSLPLPTILDPLPPSSKVSLAPTRATRQPRLIASQPAKEPGPGPPSPPRHHKPPIVLDPRPSKRLFSPRTEGMEPDRIQHLTSPRSTKVASHIMEDCEERTTEAGWQEKEARDLRRYEVVVFTPRVHMSPMPDTEPPWQVDGGRPAGTSTNWALHMEPDCCLNSSTKDPVAVGVAEMAEERCCPLNVASVDTSWASSRPSLVNFYGGHLVGVRHRQIARPAGVDRCVQRETPFSDPGLMLPLSSEAPQGCLPPVSLAPLVSQGQGREAQARQGLTRDFGVLKPKDHHLPTIQEGCVRPGAAVGPVQAQSERTEHQKRLRLPLLIPGAGNRGMGGDGEKRGGEREEHKRQDREKEDAGGEGIPVPPQRVCRQVTEQAGVQLEPEEECPPPLGVLPPLARRQGPARQYFLSQYRPDPQDETWEDTRTVVRGTLPLELREGQKGQPWGTLIMGPDGEIIQLSLWDPKADAGDPSHLDDVTQENALRVLSSEGEKLPWIILLQPEATDADKQGCETTDPSGEGMKRNSEAILPNKDASHPIPAPRSGAQGILGDLQQRGERHALGHRSPSRGDRTRQAPSAHFSDDPSTTDKAERNISAAVANDTHSMEMTKQEAREDTGNDVRRYLNKEAVKKRWKETEQVKTNRGHRQTQSNRSPPQPGEVTSSSGHAASEQLNSNPNATERLSQGAWSGRRNLRHSEGPLTPCGSGGYSENLEESVHSERQLQRNGGQRQEGNDHPTRRSRKSGEYPEKDSETLESTTADPTGVQKKKKRKGKKANQPEANQRGSSKEEAGKTSSSPGKTMKKGRVKHQAEFVVGKAKVNVEVDPGERVERVAGFKETSLALSPATEGRGPREEDEEDTEEKEEREEGEEDSSLELDTNRDDSEEDTVLSPVSGASTSPSNQRASNKSSVGRGGQASSRGHLSSCSAIMATDQLALKPVASEASNSTSTTKEDIGAGRKEQQRAVLAEKAERRRQEVERKRREREEERRRQQEREDREERLKKELDDEKRQRAEELRLKRLEEEEERKRLAEEETERTRREQEEVERDRRRKEERKRQLERLQRMRQEEEERRAAEMERQRLEEERRREDERKMLLEMEESERIDYLRRRKEEEEERRRVEEERRIREHEAALWAREQARLQAEIMARQQAALEQQLRFRRGLLVEAEALGQTQDISRPWVYSYFTLLHLLGLSDPISDPSTTQADPTKEMT